MGEEERERADRLDKNQHFTPNELVLEAISLCDFKKGMKVLEPSFGDGAFILELEKINGIEITAIDIDERMVQCRVKKKVQKN